MSEWIEKSLGEITSYLAKGIPPKYVDESNENTIYVLNQKCNRDFAISYESARIHDLSKKKVAEEKMITPGDVLINSTGQGTAGRVAQIWNIPYPTTTDGHMILLRPTEEVDVLYYGYAIKSHQVLIESLAEGSTGQTEINRQRLQDEVVIAFPKDKSEQHKIAVMLDDIDRKISINNQINRNLSEQAQAVFNSWFVKYEPFDEPMKETPTGFEAPESFEYVQIDSLEHVLETGRRPKGGAVTEGIPSVGAESVKGIGTFNTSSTKYIPVDFAAKQKTGKVNGYELMIYKDGGKPGEFHPNFSMFGEGYPFDEFFINEHVFKLDFGDRGYNEFAYFWFQTDYVMHWLESNGGKAAIPGINQTVVNSIWILSPDSPKVKEYCEWIQPLFTQILKNCYSNLRLAELRDTLLPKLMSGELDVSDLNV